VRIVPDIGGRKLWAAALGAGLLVLAQAPPAAACRPVTRCVEGVEKLAGDLVADAYARHPLKLAIGLPVVIDVNRVTKTSTIGLLGTTVKVLRLDAVPRVVFTQTVPQTLAPTRQLLTEVGTPLGLVRGESGAGTRDQVAASAALEDRAPPPCVTSYYGDNFVAYRPLYAWGYFTQGYVQYLYAPFSLDNARQEWTPSGKIDTWQLELCAVGGGRSAGGWRLNMVGTYMTVQDFFPRIIAWAVKNGPATNLEQASLNFQVEWKTITISASINIAANHKQAGGQGALGLLPESDLYPWNAVYQYWDGRDSIENPWQGSDGNVRQLADFAS
jgi:hypothetical protein